MALGLQRRGTRSSVAPPTSYRYSMSEDEHQVQWEKPPPVQRIVALNAPQPTLQLGQRIVYERFLPGGTYVSARVSRQQPGYFRNDRIGLHLARVHFLAVSFTFHAANGSKQRFKSAEIAVGLSCPPPRVAATEYPRIVKFAPHLVYGAISPETMKWEFNLAGSLGVTQSPVNASFQPNQPCAGEPTVYGGMRIQGSGRTAYVRRAGRSPGKRAASEQEWAAMPDGEVVWTVEENPLQRSGLPAEFTFAMLVARPYGLSDRDVQVHVRINPVVTMGAGRYPKWFLDRFHPPAHTAYAPPLTLDYRTGQPFDEDPMGEEEFNFAQLMEDFDEQVELPGTTYTPKDPIKTIPEPYAPSQVPQPWPDESPTGRFGETESRSYGTPLAPTLSIARSRYGTQRHHNHSHNHIYTQIQPSNQNQHNTAPRYNLPADFEDDPPTINGVQIMEMPSREV